MADSQSPSLEIIWRTAVKSGSDNCVQVARQGAVVMIADSKNPGGPVLSYTLQEFDAFLDGAKKGEFDDFLNLRQNPANCTYFQPSVGFARDKTPVPGESGFAGDQCSALSCATPFLNHLRGLLRLGST